MARGLRIPTGQARLAAALLAIAALLAAAPAAAAKPEWVERHGLSSAHPPERFVTGYGSAKGDDALARAKQDAAADLARRLSVRIESEVSDVSEEDGDGYRYKLAAVTRTTTDLKLSDLQYEEPYKRWGRVHVLAFVERGRAGRAQVAARDRAIRELRACMAAGAEEKAAGRKGKALAVYETCRRPIAQALHHDAVARALSGGATDREAVDELLQSARALDREIESVLAAPARSLAGAAETLALQLKRQGVSTRGRIVVSHLSYGTTNLSSSFGRQSGIELERALARSGGGPTETNVANASVAAPADVAVQGFYMESDDRLRLSVMAREITTGRLVASAEAVMPSAAVPANLELKPANFDTALRDQRILREGEKTDDGGLRVQVSTNRGRGGLVYTESETIRLFVRVNQPAWVRLVYVLQNGAQVPIDQAFRISASRVDTDVLYPAEFDVVPPYGIEMIHAIAFTEKPAPLATRERVIEGQRYEVVADGIDSVVRTRGIAARKRKPIAEDTLTVTTMPRL